MSITDELREWKGNINTRLQPETVLALRSELNCIADRIDEEHERAMAASALIAGVPITDENMAEHGMIRLPVDADGEVIHVRDKLDGYGKTITVVEMRYGRSGWVLISEYGNAYADCFAFTHHHEPTVEDVLREFAEKITDSQIPGVHPTYEEAIAEYAAKLQLREVDE